MATGASSVCVGGCTSMGLRGGVVRELFLLSFSHAFSQFCIQVDVSLTFPLSGKLMTVFSTGYFLLGFLLGEWSQKNLTLSSC
jgi:hypothetical protein